MRKIFFLLSVFLFSFCSISYADRGAIPFGAKGDVKIFEPTQRAIVAWNGREEILLLSTDSSASMPTKVLEVLPLPSEPTVKKGDMSAFKNAVDALNKEVAKKYSEIFEKYDAGKYSISLAASKGLLSASHRLIPSGEVVTHEKIGVHDIFVTHVINKDGFVDWVQKYLKSTGLENPNISDEMKSIVDGYLKEGFSWFVFDVISLDEKVRTSEAIKYRFSTKSLFYPLKISATRDGESSITLLILSHKLKGSFLGIPEQRINNLNMPVNLGLGQIKKIDEDIGTLFAGESIVKSRIWELTGALSSFDKDLIAE